MATRTAIYLRISQDRAGQEAGVQRQQKDCAALAESRGWTDTAVYTDNDQSARGYGKRKEYEALMCAVDAGEVAHIVVWQSSRLWRNRRERAEGIERLARAQATLTPVKGPELDMTTAYGRGMAGLVGEFDTMEIEVKSERQKAAAAQAAQAGKTHGGPRPFGYGVEVSGKVDYDLIREDEAEALRTAYDAIVAGTPLQTVAKTLNEQGWRTTVRGHKSGDYGLWTATTLRNTLCNPRNAGFRAHVTAEGTTGTHSRVLQRVDAIVGRGQWPAIVSEETFRAAVKLVTDPERRTGPRPARSLLTGLALCGKPDCGATVSTGRTDTGKRVYRCSAFPGHMARAADPVDDFVRKLIAARLGRADARGKLAASTQTDAAELTRTATLLRTQLDEWAADRAEDRCTRSQFQTATTKLRARLSIVEGKLADAGRRDVLVEVLSSDDPASKFRSMTKALQRLVIDALTTVTLLPPGRGNRRFDPATVVID